MVSNVIVIRMDHQRILSFRVQVKLFYCIVSYTSTGVVLGGSGVQEGSRSSACKLEEHRQQGLVKDGNHLGGSRGGSSKQISMASKCGPMHPLGRGLNQGQGM